MPKWTAKKRRAGVILHPTSLPGPYGIGELGSEAFAMLDWLERAGMQCWQLLPMVLPDPMYYSPYSGTDANCGNPLVISIDTLIKDSLLDPADAPAHVAIGDVDFAAVAEIKTPLLQKAARRLLDASAPSQSAAHSEYQGYMQFRQQHPWIEESALFDVARCSPALSQLAWWQWPQPLRLRDPAALREFAQANKDSIDEFVATQYLFDKQWKAVKAYANARQISIVGDMPIYVGGPLHRLGCPPDAFSATGQLWGSPLYRWDAHEAEGYAWWASRLKRAMQLYDETRIDHFRGFAGYWAVDASAETAMGGKWQKGPGQALFDGISARIGAVPILAEDLGVITADVVNLREYIKAPGMVVLQFAWGGGSGNVHLPHRHYENSFVYPGTHDNETAVGWFKGSANEVDKRYIANYLRSDGSDIAWDFIDACMSSVSCTCIMMMQDVMRLDNTARMNTPGVAAGNWRWRVGDSAVWKQLDKEAVDLRSVANFTGRLPYGVPEFASK
ncbi:MAG: hypothetical protein WDW36_006201 [Sanguina aurantia]